MKNWYKKACANNRFWDVWERHDRYSAVSLPIYVAKSDYGRASIVMDFETEKAHADVYLDPKSVPVGYESAELRFGNTLEATGAVQSNERAHSVLFEIEPQFISKLASLDADGSLWWFMHLRLWRSEDAEPVVAGSDDQVVVSKCASEIMASLSHDLRKWETGADWKRVDSYLQTPRSDFVRSLLMASDESVARLESALLGIPSNAVEHLERGDEYLIENWEKMKRWHARTLAAVAARRI